MMVTTLVAMVSNVRTFYLQKNYLLLGVGVARVQNRNMKAGTMMLGSFMPFIEPAPRA